MSLRNFCSFSLIDSGEITLPIDTDKASKFLVFLREQGYSKFSIKLGLVALKWANSFFPRADSLNEPFLDRIIASANRNIISCKNQKAPLSKSMIDSFLDLKANASLSEIRNSLLPALSFSLLLRNDELRHLSCAHIEKREEGMIFRIVSSKTDVFRKGKNLYLADTKGPKSLVSLLFKYMSLGEIPLGSNNFLFGEIRRKPTSGKEYVDSTAQLSYNQCLSIIKSKVTSLGLNSNLYGTHSARSGGASTLATRVTPFELMLSGRWADARSLRNYVEVSDKRRFQISENLLN